ncbi:MAG: F510_1955 family glycosylhydrolase [Solirubrobacteraceae bacterium]
MHVHGLGVNPADGALFVATHTGLFRAAPDEPRARRVARRYQDTMGFAIVGPDRFLGSGHPDLREELPPFLGLIESRDAGRSWRAQSLQGKVDFHVLEASDRRIYGYGSDFESREPRFLTSEDGGRRWQSLTAPEPLVSLAISPTDSSSLIASGERRVFRSRDGGRSWSTLDSPAAGLLAWNASGVFLVGGTGRVWRSTDAGSWRAAGSIGGQPSALDNGRGRDLLVALHDGTIKRSADAGRVWTVRSAAS